MTEGCLIVFCVCFAGVVTESAPEADEFEPEPDGPSRGDLGLHETHVEGTRPKGQ